MAHFWSTPKKLCSLENKKNVPRVPYRTQYGNRDLAT